LSYHYLSQLTRMFARHRLRDYVSAVRNKANPEDLLPRHWY
jgi:hypothetical protein